MAKKSIARIDAHRLKIIPKSNGNSEMVIYGQNSKGTETRTTVDISDWSLIDVVRMAGKIARKRVSDARFMSDRILNAINE